MPSETKPTRNPNREVTTLSTYDQERVSRYAASFDSRAAALRELIRIGLKHENIQ
ncbi:hypothetical protein [Hymenobacter glacieicola]|uniref:CopG family transcriptional regulator n=1 Tax=Hymenobacter glacieicola TaxID=1562124 RepID=A0ABQ1X8Y6_9BACT|nr:hypothetical protein [Hymenobacter glacieicola]GGG61225.1 hypothetical protein GCM10011378_41540 [Hymenobacter glacieicola]